MNPIIKYVAIITATAAVSVTGTCVAYNIKSTTPVSADSNFSKLNSIRKLIDKDYLYTDLDKGKLEDGAAKGFVEALDEPYTHYYTKDEFSSYVSNIEESYVGIGVVIYDDTDSDKIRVIAPIEDSPAMEVGILPNDYIIAVDGKEYKGSQMQECVNAIKGGKEGTSVIISIERNGEKTDYTINRKELMENSVKSKEVDNNIGYVRISSFNTNTVSKTDTSVEFKEQVDKLKADGMQKMIIDLRDNPGGVLDVVVKVADYLLPNGVITYTETRAGKRETYNSDDSELNIPLVVLVNGNSASAAEILTGALKDYGRAKIVGEKTFGKGIVQTVFPFYDGTGISMTTAKYYTPNGTCIQGIGIAPDFEVSLPEEYREGYASNVPEDKDTQLQKALELLQ